MYDIHHQSIWFDSFINCFDIHPQQLFSVDAKDNSLYLFQQLRNYNRFIRSVTLKPLGFGPNDFFLLGTQPDNSSSAAAYYATALDERRQEWDYLELSEVPETDPFIQPFVNAMRSKGYPTDVKKIHSFYHIDLTGDWESHYQQYIHKRISDLRTRINKLNRDGYSYEVISMTKGIDAYLDAIFLHYRERRNHTGQLNAFSDPQYVRMLKQIIPAYEKQGWMMLSILKGNDGKDWAYQLDFIKDGIRYHYAPTFDMHYAAYSPSKILLLETIKAGFSDPAIKEFNFMRGESDYKKQFASQKTAYINLRIVNPHSKRNRIYKLYNKLSHIKAAFR